MKNKLILLSLFLSISLSSCAKESLAIKSTTKVDTIINTGIYKSYFNLILKEPLYVTYKLYKGGGECDRAGFHFRNDTKIQMATSGDYGLAKMVNSGIGYDMGHLANSEDFANDCIKDEKTFRFYNCLPQTPNLNRGCWKKWETTVRNESQLDSLLIICGGIFKDKKMGNIYVPDLCWKVVKSLSKNTITHVLLFTNTNTATVKELSLADLEKLLNYKIPTKF